jgi:ribosomal protein S4
MGRRKYLVSRGLIDLSWGKYNLYNIHAYSKKGPEREISRTKFQVFSHAKKLTVGYHLCHMDIKDFRRTMPKIPNIARIPHPSNKNDPSTWINDATNRFLLADSQGKVLYPTPPTTMLMFSYLERRADMCIFRACFAPSIYEARYLCNSGSVTVNGKKIQNPSYILEDGDILQVSGDQMSLLNPEKRRIDDFGDITSRINKKTSNSMAPSKDWGLNPVPFMAPFVFIPEYLEVNPKNLTVCFLRSPTVGPGKCELPSPYDHIMHARTFDFFSKYRGKFK